MSINGSLEISNVVSVITVVVVDPTIAPVKVSGKNYVNLDALSMHSHAHIQARSQTRKKHTSHARACSTITLTTYTHKNKRMHGALFV